MLPSDRLLVLDVHGVVFTNPLIPYLAETAERLGRDSSDVLHLWTSALRRPFWLGQLEERALWETLFPGADADALSAELERRYEPGPLFEVVGESGGPAWLLSNHRSEWLLPRLARFGLEGRFERVLVSDAIGLVKPDIGAFRLVRRLAGDRPITYVDDKLANVETAASVFEQAVHVADAHRLVSVGPRAPRAAQDGALPAR